MATHELEFRAWHKPTQTIINDVQTLDSFAQMIASDEYVIDQWSGYKDINGKKIFSRDAVTFEIKGLGSGTAECYYSAGCFWLKVFGQADPFPMYEYEYRSDIIIEVTEHTYQQ